MCPSPLARLGAQPPTDNGKESNGDTNDGKGGSAMTARPGGSRPVAGRPWAAEALCARDTRFTDGPFGVERDAFLYARQLAHRCRAHCPAVADCANGLTAPGATRPREAVQAGIYFPPDYRQLPRTLPDPGCGPHCAGLPAVHREVVPV